MDPALLLKAIGGGEVLGGLLALCPHNPMQRIGALILAAIMGGQLCLPQPENFLILCDRCCLHSRRTEANKDGGARCFHRAVRPRLPAVPQLRKRRYRQEEAILVERKIVH